VGEIFIDFTLEESCGQSAQSEIPNVHEVSIIRFNPSNQFNPFSSLIRAANKIRFNPLNPRHRPPP
jgi:hypothetical protein